MNHSVNPHQQRILNQQPIMTCPEPTPKPECELQLNQLNVSLEKLSDEIAQLFHRMEPLLLPEKICTKEQCVKDTVPMSPFAERLHYASSQMDNLYFATRDHLRRLQV